MVDEVQAHMKEMLEECSICPSQSPWCNAVVLVHKKDIYLHFCTDFHKLNDRTKKDSYLLPLIQEAIGSLFSARYFSCLDLKAGFWQIAMDEASKQYTAFTVGNLGFFKCKHMLFRLCNAPAMFQRLMQNSLREWNLTYCLIYLDEVIVFLKVEEEHLQLLHIVFNHFREHNLRLKSTKCKFLWRLCSPAKRTLKLWLSLLHAELTEKSKPFWAWWDTTFNSSKGLCILCNHCMNIYLGKVLVRRMSR